MYLKSAFTVLVILLTMQSGFSQHFPAPNQNVKDAFSLATSLFSSHRNNQSYENRINAIVTISATTSDPEQLVREYTAKMRQLQDEAEQRKQQKEAELRKQIDLINKGVDEALKAADVDLGTWGNLAKDLVAGASKNVLVANANKKIELARAEAQTELDAEMEKAMGGIYEQIVKENQDAQKEYLYAAAEVFSEREEQHYIAYFQFHNCMLESMKKNYNFRSADWLKTGCPTPPRTYFSAGQSAQLDYARYNPNQNTTTDQPDLSVLTSEGQIAAIDKKLEESVKKMDDLIAKTDDAFQKVEYLSLKQSLIDKANQEKEAINRGEFSLPDQPMAASQQNSKRYQPLLETAIRKLKHYKNDMPYPEFLDAAKKYAEAELSENNQNSEAYLFLAELTDDVTKKYELTAYALYLNRGNTEVIKKFNDAKSSFGNAVFSAIENNNMTFITEAYNRNLLNGFEHNKNTPFQYAVAKDNAEAMELLMPQGTDSYALLFYVIENGGGRIAKNLINKVNVNKAPILNGFDLLTAAVYFDKKSITTQLLEKGFAYNNSLDIAMYSSNELYKKMTTTLSVYAIEHDNASMLDQVLIKTPSIVQPDQLMGDNVVNAIVKANRTNLLPILIKHKLNVKQPDYAYLLELAANSNSEEIALMLVDLGINLNHQPKSGGSMINLLASKQGMNRLFNVLIEKGVTTAALNNNDELPIMTCMRNAQHNKSKKLLEVNSPLGFGSKLSGNQIHWIVENNIESGFIELLVQHKIPVEGKDKNGDSPLFYAYKENKPVYVNALLNLGADPTQMNNSQIAVLHYAVYQKSSLLPGLIQKCSNTNVQGINGWTPLHFAVREGNYEAVNQLLAANANPLIADKWGRTPYRVAKEYGNADIQKVLRKKMKLGGVIKTAYAFNKKKPNS